MSTAAAYATPFPTRSTLARTRSPGMAPDTSTTSRSARAIMRPPAAGLSIVSGTTSPTESMGMQQSPQRPLSPQSRSCSACSACSAVDGVSQTRSSAGRSFANESIDRRFSGALERLGAHGRAKAGQLLVGFARQSRARRFVQSGPRGVEQLPVQSRQPLDERLPLRPAHAAGHEIELARDAVEQIVEPGIEVARSPAPRSDASALAPCVPAATVRDGRAAIIAARPPLIARRPPQSPRSRDATRRTYRGRPLRRNRSGPAAGADPWRSTARNTDRFRGRPP